MVLLLHTKIPQVLPQDVNWLAQLPKQLIKTTRRFNKDQDKVRYFLGKLLLKEGCRILGFKISEFDKLNYNYFGKPFIANDINFNISHSGSYVVCAIARNVQLGVDIEEILPINFVDYENVMSIEEWSIINKSANPFKEFFSFWTRKESILKADGRGLSILLNEVIISEMFGEVEGQKWYLKELKLDENYCGCLATNCEDEILFKEFKYTNFFT